VTVHKWTLVLNKHWTPITVTSIFGAMRLLCRESANVVDTESYERLNLLDWINRDYEGVEQSKLIKLSSGNMERPEVILLTQYGGIPYKEINWSRRNLYKRDKYKCQYCNVKYPSSGLSIDHIVPRSRGGRTSWENCVSSCVDCNAKKADRSLKESGMKLLKKPSAPKWSPILSFLPPVYPDSWKKFIKI
jgi:5-methylcytosine-specific restriction endonuclease McrA